MNHKTSSRMRQSLQHFVVASLAVFCLGLGGCDFFTSTETRIARADSMMAAANYRAALIELKNIVQSDPENVQARLKLARVSLQLGDAISAEKEMRRALELGAKPADAGNLIADIRIELGQYRELLTQIDSGQLALAEPQLSTYRGQALLGTKQIDAALTAFRAATDAFPGDSAARVGLAEALAAQGSLDAALAELDKALTNNPNDASAGLARGSILAQRGQFEQAQQALQHARDHAEALTVRQLGMLLATMTETQLARGDVEAARDSHKELARIAPDWAGTRILTARIAIASQDYLAAATELQRVVAAAPDTASARFLLGATLLAQGSLNQAEQHLSKALQLAPDNIEARKMLAQVRLQLSRPDAAMQVLMGAQSHDSDPQLDALVGKTYFQQGEVAQGLAHLERAVAAKPNNRNLKLDLAEGYLRAGQSRKAMDLLQSISRVGTDTRRESLLLAALAQIDGVKAARAQAERWVDEAPRDIALLNLAAAFLARQGDFVRARAVLGKATALDPANVPTLLTWARLEAADGNPAAAAKWLEKALAAEPGNVPAQLALAELAVRRGDLAAAKQRLEDMRSKDAAAIAPRLQLLRIFLRGNENSKAAEVTRELLVGARDRADVLNAVGSLYVEVNRYEEGLAHFRHATDIDGGNATYWMNTASAQLALDHRSAAREALQRALNERPDWVPAVAALTMLDLRDNRRDAAMNRVAALRKALPQDPAAMVLEGHLYMALQQYEPAAAAFAAAGKVQNDATIAIKTYVARKAGKLDAPLAPLEAWLKQSPDDLVVRNVLAQAYQQMGQTTSAIEQYRIVIARDEKNVAALNNLAWLYYEIKDPLALETARRAYALAPNVPAVADTYGWILVQTDNVAEGLAVLRKAVAGGKVDPETEYHYAVALARAGERTQARERLAKLLAAQGEFASQSEARRLLDQLGGA